jgi:hypothetical protein
MQVCQEVKKINGEVSTAALVALSAAAAMVELSPTVMTRAIASILLEDANCLVPQSLLLPPRKMFRMSHQQHIDHQNKQKSKEVYTQVLVQAMTLIAAKKMQAKENRCTMPSVIAQVEPSFRQVALQCCSVARKSIDTSGMTWLEVCLSQKGTEGTRALCPKQSSSCSTLPSSCLFKINKSSAR